MIWVIGNIIIKCLALIVVYMVMCELNYILIHNFNKENCPRWNFWKYTIEEK